MKEQTDRLGTLQNRNEQLRTTAQRLLTGSTREEAESIVVDGLAAIPECEAVGLFRPGTGEGDVNLASCAGTGTNFFELVHNHQVDDTAPTLAARRTDSTVHIDRIASRLHDGDWEQAALDRDFQTVLTIPLSYDRINHGILTIYASDTALFSEESVTLFEEFAQTVGPALALLESRSALQSGYNIEVELAIQSGEIPLSTLAAQLDSSVRIDRIEVVANEVYTIVGTAQDADPDRVREVISTLEFTRSVGRIESTDDAVRFNFTGSLHGVLTHVIGHGGMIRLLAVEPGETPHRLVLLYPSETIVSQSIQQLTDRYEGARLVAHRPIGDEAGKTIETANRSLSDEHTRVLRTALQHGFFERSREHSGEELADRLGISSSTFHRRLRSAQKELLTNLFGQ